MKLSVSSVVLALCALTSYVEARGSINNKHNAAAIHKQSINLPPGKYKFKNAKTGKWLTYKRSGGQSVFPASGGGSWFSIKRHDKHIVISPTSSNNKCLSAQWDYDIDADWAMILYSCAVTHFKREASPEPALRTLALPAGDDFNFDDVIFGSTAQVEAHADLEEVTGLVGRSEDASEDVTEEALEKRWSSQGALRGAKQYFYVHGAKGRNTYHIVPEDHILDMKTRVMGAAARRARYNKGISGPSLIELNHSDKSQEWYVYNAKGRLVAA